MYEEKVLLRAVLTFLQKDGQILLPLKKLKIGAGRRNGYGGGIEPGEDPYAATVREVAEECGVVADPADIHPMAVVDFHNTKQDGGTFTCRALISTLSHWSGEPKESAEMGPPEWFPTNVAPVQEMMLADQDWFPHMLAGKCIYAEAWYGPRQQTILRPTEVAPISKDELDRLWHA